MTGLSPYVAALVFLAGAFAGAPLAAAGLVVGRNYPVVMSTGNWVYPAAMLVTGTGTALLVADYSAGGDMAELAAGLVLLALLVTLSASDLKRRILPDRLVIPAIVVFGAFRLLFHPLPLWHYALGFLLAGGIPYLVSLAAVRLGREPMGGGDIKLMALIGLAAGAERAVLTLLFASLIGLAAGGLLRLAGKFDGSRFLPFGPAILPAAMFSWLYGQEFLAWYCSLFLF
jgi:leader peptidase (prepilin peptidase)/N-methyltransferase